MMEGVQEELNPTIETIDLVDVPEFSGDVHSIEPKESSIGLIGTTNIAESQASQNSKDISQDGVTSVRNIAGETYVNEFGVKTLQICIPRVSQKPEAKICPTKDSSSSSEQTKIEQKDVIPSLVKKFALKRTQKTKENAVNAAAAIVSAAHRRKLKDHTKLSTNVVPSSSSLINFTKKQKNKPKGNAVKIKMGFTSRFRKCRENNINVIDRSKKMIIEDEFEAKERDAAMEAEASRKLHDSRAVENNSEVNERCSHMSGETTTGTDRKKYQRTSSKKYYKSTSSSSEDEDSSTDEYDAKLPPMRAAAVAALEAVVKGKNAESMDLTKLWRPVKTPKGKSRRSLSKRALVQQGIRHYDDTVGTSHTRLSAFVNGEYYQIGDIIAVKEEGEYYFAQIDRLLNSDQNPTAEIVWLTPTIPCEPFPFNPRCYKRRDDVVPSFLGMDQVVWRIHCPAAYFTCPLSYFTPRPGIVYQRVIRPLVVQVDSSDEDDDACEHEETGVNNSSDENLMEVDKETKNAGLSLLLLKSQC